ncbi:MAG: sensor histidine kinase [Microbacteriaceae bacterium]|nr:sensor histidine kinase [Microbacteriaceae bacterium]
MDDHRRELSQFLTLGEEPELHEAIGHLPRGRGILGLLIDQPVPIRLQDVSQHPRSYGFPPGHPPMAGFLGAPIVIREEAWGNLYLTEKQGRGDFDDDDLEAIVVLAEWASIAIDNARLFGTSERRRVQLEHAVGRLEAARNIAFALGDETDLARILTLIVGRARSLVDADSLLIWLIDDDVLRLATHAGSAAPIPGVALTVDGSTSGAALRSGTAVRVDDVSTGLTRSAARSGRWRRRRCRSSPEVAQEALTMVAKHAHAGRVRLRLSATATRLDLTVEDNGRGFATAQPHRAGATACRDARASHDRRRRSARHLRSSRYRHHPDALAAVVARAPDLYRLRVRTGRAGRCSSRLTVRRLGEVIERVAVEVTAPVVEPPRQPPRADGAGGLPQGAWIRLAFVLVV